MHKYTVQAFVFAISILVVTPTMGQQPVTVRERETISRAIERRIADLEVDRSKQLVTHTQHSAQVQAIEQQLQHLRTRLADLHQVRRPAEATRPVTRRERQTIMRAIEARIADLEVERPLVLTQFTLDRPEARSIDEQLFRLRERLAELAYGTRPATATSSVVAGSSRR